ncbi:methyltransferase [Streptosporangium soli]|nr:hypothetical protein [Streptosporangium sp. KLBMP 9127]
MSAIQSVPSLVRTATRFFEAQALFAGIELGLFGRVAETPAEASELRDELGLHPSITFDYLDALVSMGLLSRDGSRYVATPIASSHLDPAKPDYIGGFLSLNQRRLYPAWGNLAEFLKSGESVVQKLSGGSSPMPSLYSDSARTRSFAEGMDGYAVLLGGPLAEKFDWAGVDSFTDLGGCRGMLTTRIAAAHPHLRGVTFDLPPLKPLFEELVGDGDLRDRVSFQAGDFFADPLPDTQVYIAGHVLHDWVVERRRDLIRSAFDHLPPGGSFIIYDSMIDDDRSSATFNLLMSLNMALVSGSSEYTVAEGTRWLAEAGFTVREPVALNGLTTMLVGDKPS